MTLIYAQLHQVAAEKHRRGDVTTVNTVPRTHLCFETSLSSSLFFFQSRYSTTDALLYRLPT